MNGEYAALANRIEQSLSDVERTVSRAEMLLKQAQLNDDDGYLDGVALNLHGYYAGIENIFQDIARSVDGSMPDGPDWHRALLLQMSGKTHGIRPKVIRYETRVCLDEYRRFRHIVRNVYTFNLRPSRLQELTDELRACYEDLSLDIARFTAFLTELAEQADT